MKNRHLTLLILLFLTLTNIAYLHAQFNAPRFQRITTAEGLPDGEVKQIREDKDGFIWIATAQGICRYDGHKTQLLRGGTAISTKYLAIDRPMFFCWDDKYRWWIGSDWAGIRVYDATKQHFFHIRDKHWSDNYPGENNEDTLTNSNISVVLCDSESKIWIGTYQNGIDIFDTKKGHLDKSGQYGTDLFKDCQIRKIDKDAKGNIWVAALKKGLWRFNEARKTWSSISTHQNIQSFSFDTEGGVWFISDNQIFHYNAKTNQTQIFYQGLFKNSSKKLSFLKIHCDRTGRIWIGTGNGLILLRGNNIPPEFLKQDQKNPYSLLSDYINEIFEDSKGNIWIGCANDGVCVLPNTYDKIQVFDNPTTTVRIQDIVVASDSTLYGVTETYLLTSRFPYYHTDFMPIETFIPRTHTTLHRIAIGQNGQIYLGTNHGIWQYQPKEKRCRFICPISNNPAFILQQGMSSLKVWGDTLLTFSLFDTDGLTLVDLKNKTSYLLDTPEKNYNKVFTNGMLQDNQGIFWATSYEGLARLGTLKTPFSKVTFAAEFYKGDSTENNNSSTSLLKIGNLLLWGRDGGGGFNVLSFKDSTHRIFLKKNGLFDNSVTALERDKTGGLWAGTYFGVCRIQIPDNFLTAEQLKVQNYSFADGLPHNTVTRIVTTLDSSKIFVGTVGGLAMINTEGGDTAAPKLVFTALNVYNKAVNPNDSFNILTTDINETDLLTLHHYQAFFTLEVSGLHFANPKQTRYVYRLSGLGNDWMDNGFNNIISFNNMASGEYLLEVKAMSNNGAWSAVKMMNIKVLPPFWARWWFISVLVLLFLSGVYGLYQFRINQMRRVQDLQNSLAADLHDDIGSALSNIEILGFLTQNQDQLPEKAQKLIMKMAYEAKKTNESLHQLVWTMHAENEGLEATLAKLNRMAVDSLEPQGITLSVDEPQQITDTIKLGREKQRDLIMVYKEILTNISKHAQATRVTISISLKQGLLMIDIEDNGAGFNPQPQNGFGGNGLTNMTKRMAKYGGSTTVKNRADAQGTVAQIRLPM
jgi:ligand-binding sensor domain-containing protein